MDTEKPYDGFPGELHRVGQSSSVSRHAGGNATRAAPDAGGPLLLSQTGKGTGGAPMRHDLRRPLAVD